MKSRIFAINSTDLLDQELKGEGNKKVLVLISELESQEKTLDDLLKAIKLDPTTDIYKLVIPSNKTVDISSLISSREITKVISFGFSTKDIGYNVNQAFYHIYEFSNHHLIMSESIKELNDDKNKKIALWKSLQQAFL